MSDTKVNYDDIEPVPDGMRFLRDPLEYSQLGLTVLECAPGWTGKGHDHGENGQEWVNVLVEGAAAASIGGETAEMTAGDVLRVDSDTSRQIHNGDEESLFVRVGAP